MVSVWMECSCKLVHLLHRQSLSNVVKISCSHLEINFSATSANGATAGQRICVFSRIDSCNSSSIGDLSSKKVTVGVHSAAECGSHSASLHVSPLLAPLHRLSVSLVQ